MSAIVFLLKNLLQFEPQYYWSKLVNILPVRTYHKFRYWHVRLEKGWWLFKIVCVFLYKLNVSDDLLVSIDWNQIIVCGLF